MNEIWYILNTMEDDGVWDKIKYLPEQSALSDVFEFMEDRLEPLRRHKKGMTLTMDYGCMGKLMDKKELLTEVEFLEMKMNKVLLWLDDYRNPEVSPFLQKYVPDHSAYKIVWVKSYNEFVEWISENGLPLLVSFDHDLADEHYAPPDRYADYNKWAEEQNFQEKTGMDCAKWLIDYCLDNELELPTWVCHTANPAGFENMSGLLKSFMKHQVRNGIVS